MTIHKTNPFKLKRDWMSLPAYKRRDAAVRLKWKAVQCPWFGGRFWSRLYIAMDSRIPLNEDGSHPLPEASWTHILFPSQIRRDVIYNASITTLSKEYLDAAQDQAWEAMEAHLRTTGQEMKEWNGPAEISHGHRVYPWLNNWDSLDFGGKTMREFLDAKQAEILALKAIPVPHGFCRVIRACEYGMGLDIRANVKNLDKEAIVSLIDKFIANGEKGWDDPADILDVDDLGPGPMGLPVASVSRKEREEYDRDRIGR